MAAFLPTDLAAAQDRNEDYVDLLPSDMKSPTKPGSWTPLSRASTAPPTPAMHHGQPEGVLDFKFLRLTSAGSSADMFDEQIGCLRTPSVESEDDMWFANYCPRTSAPVDYIAERLAASEQWYQTEWVPTMPPLQSWLGRWAEGRVHAEECGLEFDDTGIPESDTPESDAEECKLEFDDNSVPESDTEEETAIDDEDCETASAAEPTEDELEEEDDAAWFDHYCPHASVPVDYIAKRLAASEEWHQAEWAPMMPPLQSWLGRWAEGRVLAEECGVDFEEEDEEEEEDDEEEEDGEEGEEC